MVVTQFPIAPLLLLFFFAEGRQPVRACRIHGDSTCPALPLCVVAATRPRCLEHPSGQGAGEAWKAPPAPSRLLGASARQTDRQTDRHSPSRPNSPLVALKLLALRLSPLSAPFPGLSQTRTSLPRTPSHAGTLPSAQPQPHLSCPGIFGQFPPSTSPAGSRGVGGGCPLTCCWR